MRRVGFWGVAALISLAAAGSAWLWLRPRGPEVTASAPPEPAQHVGSDACARCHANEARAWRESHHARAMQEASARTVLGDFSDTGFRYGEVTSTFSTRDGRYFVTTDGPDGALREYPIGFTFGVTPLQQYLIELEPGRWQALSIAWDARPTEQGGQRWYHLYPDGNVDHRDVLHWTRRSQNWNHMCAECHTTGFAKRYDLATARYDSRFAEIGVGCEACHGPGARHVAWAERGADAIADRGLGVPLDERRGVAWIRDPATGAARRSAPRATRTEIEACARCHARRSQLVEAPPRGQALLQTHVPALLEADLYEADGQIRGEVYEYGSFLQSRMYRAGVTCSDCHEPHGARLREEGDGTCLQCHDAARFQTRTHHFHDPGSAGARCVSCHMASRTYMGVDVRRDHGFRVPQPVRSAALGTPDACTDCHAGRTAEWAAGKMRAWYGRDPEGTQQFAQALQAARANALDAKPLLLALLTDAAQPENARATAAAELARRAPDRETLDALGRALGDESAWVRHAALEGLSALPTAAHWERAAPRLGDPVLAVRIAAASLLAAPADAIPAQHRSAWESASADYLAAQRQNADQPEAHVNLGNFAAARGDGSGAERAYRQAIALDPDWVPGYANLADILRALGRDREGEVVLRDGLAHAPDAAALHHSLGLLRVRAKDLQGALAALGRATELEPGDPRFAYVYSVALHDAGRVDEAARVAREASARAPGDPQLRQWLGELDSR